MEELPESNDVERSLKKKIIVNAVEEGKRVRRWRYFAVVPVYGVSLAPQNALYLLSAGGLLDDYTGSGVGVSRTDWVEEQVSKGVKRAHYLLRDSEIPVASVKLVPRAEFMDPDRTSKLAETHPLWLSCDNDCDVVACGRPDPGDPDPVKVGRAVIKNNPQCFCRVVRNLRVYVPDPLVWLSNYSANSCPREHMPLKPRVRAITKTIL